MGRNHACRRAVGFLACAAFAAGLAGQAPHGVPSVPPAARPAPPAATPAPATHAPLPVLPPLAAFEHLQRGHAAFLQHKAKGGPAPAPQVRPAGAGKYVCAVLVCADAGLDASALFGLAPADALVLAVPGPFASPETAALLERTVADHRLSLVVVLGHADCASLQPRAQPDALQQRRDAAQAQAQRRGEDLPTAVVRLQRDLLLASSELLQASAAADRLRVMPATVDGDGRVAWRHARIDALPIAPVK